MNAVLVTARDLLNQFVIGQKRQHGVRERMNPQVRPRTCEKPASSASVMERWAVLPPASSSSRAMARRRWLASAPRGGPTATAAADEEALPRRADRGDTVRAAALVLEAAPAIWWNEWEHVVDSIPPVRASRGQGVADDEHGKGHARALQERFGREERGISVVRGQSEQPGGATVRRHGA